MNRRSNKAIYIAFIKYMLIFGSCIDCVKGTDGSFILTFALIWDHTPEADGNFC